jgi:SAM-dependent methyltransferase
MDHADHVRLLRPGVQARAGTWADVGAGTGEFSLALADLLGPGAILYVLDRDRGALETNVRRVTLGFPDTSVVPAVADFATAPLPFAPASLDGVVMANSLHFVRDKAPVLRRILATIKPGGSFVLVEYGADRGNPWVPWPISYRTWERLAGEVGLVGTRQLAEVPSRFLGSIYSAGSRTPVLHSAPYGDDREE